MEPPGILRSRASTPAEPPATAPPPIAIRQTHADDELRERLARYLDARFSGDTFDREDGLALDFRAPALSPAVELRLVERLLWAWHALDQPS